MKKCNNEKVVAENSTAVATKSKVQQLKFSDIRSRYLEPKKVYNENSAPIRSVTSSNIPSGMLRGNKTGRPHSSSGSSRRSSPALSANAASKLNLKKSAEGKSTTNMSLDSLTSVRGRSTTTNSKTGKSSDNERYSDNCADSTNDSLRSSIVTNRTTSRDSLNSTQQVKLRGSGNRNDRKKIPITTNIYNKNDYNYKLSIPVGKVKDISSNSSTGKSSRPTSLGGKTPRYLQQKVISAGSSPSSIATTKSATSRLSSVSSTQSPKSIYKRSISSTVPSQHDNTIGPRHSFLSAKSREILAKRAEKNKLQQQQQEKLKQEQQEQKHQQKLNCDKRTNLKDNELKNMAGTAVVRSASHSSVIMSSQGRSNYPSNIPTRRPNTLQLKKTYNTTSMARTATNATATSNDVINKNIYSKQQQLYKGSENNCLQFYHQNRCGDEVFKTANSVKDKMKLLIDSNSITYNENDCNQLHTASIVPATEPVTFESKLERSSTFCKESAEIVDINDQLQIIE